MASQSYASREARQARALAAAMNDIEIEADKRRKQSSKLRQLRVNSENGPAARFKIWRERQSTGAE